MSADPTTIAISRFGLGPRPGQRAQVQGDPRGWLRAQLKDGTALPPALAAMPSTRAALAQASPELREEAVKGRKRIAEMAEAPGGKVDKSDPAVQALRQLRLSKKSSLYNEHWARFEAGARSEQPFRERLARFWANHFAVSALKPLTRWLVGSYEREAIRPQVTGRFGDMLLAVSRHPAMLAYLDNHRSTGPNSPEGKRRKQGLNENLAREILELHTLGVGGGYTQADVTAFARALTGWSFHPEEGSFRFEAARHEPGEQTILGKRYAADGAAQAEAVLADLVRHPSTAKFVATKLARHFVADDPPPEAVAKLAAVFRDSGGDLGEVSRALLELPQAWQPGTLKLLTPEEYLLASQRLLLDRGGFRKPDELFAAQSRMGQVPLSPGSPAGWPDTASAWTSTDGLWKRLEIALDLGRTAKIKEPMQLALDAYGPALSSATRGALAEAESPAQAIALLLASPEVQYR